MTQQACRILKYHFQAQREKFSWQWRFKSRLCEDGGSMVFWNDDILPQHLHSITT
jgi:hypothetical protein